MEIYGVEPINLIFDYDGTLHNCIKIYAPAFRMAYAYLVSGGYVLKKNWTEEEISRWLGFTAKEMWDSFAPGLPQEQKDFCSQMIGEEMVRLTENGKAELYPEIEETLEKFKKQGYRMIFLSNCKRRYMDAHRKKFGLDRYFSAYFCAEDYGWKTKTEILSGIREQFDGRFFVIGDRFQDMEAARENQIKAVGCTYGYGTFKELACADILAGKPGELSEAVESVVRSQD